LGEFNRQPYFIIRMNATQTTTTGADAKTATRTSSLPTQVDPENSDRSSPSGPSTVAPDARSLSNSTGVQLSAKTAPIKTSAQLPRPTSKLRQAAQVLTALSVLGIFVYAGSQYLASARSRVKTDNAYLAARVHLISSRVAGTVKNVLVDENQSVAAGTVLARLDPVDFEVRQQQAVAQAAQARAHVDECAAQIAQARAQISRDQARAVKASNDLSRASSLFEGGSGAISRQELDLARAEADAADASLRGTFSALDSAIAAAAAAKAQQAVAEATLENARLQLSYTEIIAPVTGRIGKKNLEVGNHVQPGQAILALVEPETWINANFKETQLANLRAGQPVRVWIDAFPGKVFRGSVNSLSPGSGAQFALLPPDNATGNFTKIVQRVPVKITLDPASLGDCAERLVPGMSAVVEVRVK
jgi:membrane fusion protein (multidrug efflux system)